MAFEIEKGIAIPKVASGGGSTKYPWADMEIGDSFFVQHPASKNVKAATHAHNQRYPNSRFKSRSVDGGVRIWRVA